jgi:hypothetical protein
MHIIHDPVKGKYDVAGLRAIVASGKHEREEINSSRSRTPLVSYNLWLAAQIGLVC